MILAYLDPGSGSALVGTLIAVAGAALYSLKSFFYRLVSRKKADGISSPSIFAYPPIAIFSEGKNYWGTFRLIVEELISRKVHFAYYTMDLHDPALLIDSEYMHARLYDKNKTASYHKLSNLEADILLATSPNIGTPGFPIRRSPNVKKMLHVFHAFADISAYHKGSLDNYDIVLTVGPHQEKYIREVEQARNLKPKVIVPMGLPYFDAQYLSVRGVLPVTSGEDSASPLHAIGQSTILVAPSWGAKGLLREYGTGFILDLAKAGYAIIVRPHPQSFIAEAEFMAKCQAETASCDNIVWDKEPVGSVSMERSDLLISDTSSIRFDYAFLYGKPVITLDIPKTSQQAYDGVYQKTQWVDDAAPRLGRVLNHETIASVVSVVKAVLSDGGGLDVRAFRRETITNLGTSAKAIADILMKEAAHV